MRNVALLEKLSDMAGLHLLDLCRGVHERVADIGAADGDLPFFLERQGLPVEVIDNEYTNFNGLEGARILKDALNSSVAIRFIANWIQAGSTYEFRLYNLDHAKLLDKVIVTKATK
jgi:hypothetical protein